MIDLIDPEVWCDVCSQRYRASYMVEGICPACRGVEQDAHVSVALTPVEQASRVSVEVWLSESWTIDRREFPGTDVEWRELLNALQTPDRERTKEQQAVVEEVGQSLTDRGRSLAEPDIDLRLLGPTPTAVAL